MDSIQHGVAGGGNGQLLAAPQRSPGREWPELDGDALHGIAGEIVRTLGPTTEADAVGILTSFLVAFGNAAGRGPHVDVSGDKHGLNLNAVLVGESSKGRKGMTWSPVRNLMHAAAPDWLQECQMNGLSSGEGLIYAVRDPVVVEDPDTGQKDVVDEGAPDNRLLVLESEFASVLKVMGREGSILSTIVRQAWDGGKLGVMTRGSRMRATGAHVSILGHVVKDELVRRLPETDTLGGFTNRFMWVLVRRARFLPFGAKVSEADYAPLVRGVRDALDFAEGAGEIGWGKLAMPLWEGVYEELSEGDVGLVGAATSRAEAQTLRLAATYAVLDGSRTIEPEHVLAGLAVWRYAQESARYVFSRFSGDPVKDKIREGLRSRPSGLTRNQIGELFYGHVKAQRIGQALEELLAEEEVATEKRPTRGRPVEIWRLA